MSKFVVYFDRYAGLQKGVENTTIQEQLERQGNLCHFDIAEDKTEGNLRYVRGKLLGTPVIQFAFIEGEKEEVEQKAGKLVQSIEQKMRAELV